MYMYMYIYTYIQRSSGDQSSYLLALTSPAMANHTRPSRPKVQKGNPLTSNFNKRLGGPFSAMGCTKKKCPQLRIALLARASKK